MKFFDQIDPGSLERRAWQLWILALTTIFVLATGLALMMYMVAFSRPVGQFASAPTTLFAGYCVLTPLLIGYLLDRQIVIKELRRRITEEERQIVRLQHEFRSSFLENLPGLAHFQDRLAMEHRRAFRAEQPFSLVLAGVKPSPALETRTDASLADEFGRVAKVLTGKLRGEDSIYHFGGGVFGILLPRIPTSIASLVAEQLRAGLGDAAGDSSFGFELQVISFPEQAASARDMEKAVMDFLSEHSDTHPPDQTVGFGGEYRLHPIAE